MASKRLDDLAPEFRPLAVELIARAVEARLHPVIIETRRNEAEQADYVKRGLSWTMNSRHLTGHAIDIAPMDVLGHHDWEPESMLWQQLGAIGQQLGMKWGVVRQGKRTDLGHFEMRTS